MIDDWKQRVTQLGLTKTTHEYAVYQLLATGVYAKNFFQLNLPTISCCL